MGFIGQIRRYAGFYRLRLESAKLRRDKKTVGLFSARNIGLVYYLHDEESYRMVSAFVKKLQEQGKTVKALAYVENRRLTGLFLPKLSYDFFYPSGLGWNYKPKSTRVKDFIDTPFDLLLDLSLGDNLPLLYVTAMSKAKFKAGMQSDARSRLLDLMISLGEKKGLQDLIEQLEHYLKIINGKHEN